MFMANVTGATPGIIDKIVVALGALTGAVISMIKHHRQHGLLGGVLITIALGE
jgi:hypothetical protein